MKENHGYSGQENPVRYNRVLNAKLEDHPKKVQVLSRHPHHKQDPL